MSDYSWIGPLIGGIGKGFNSFTAGNQANQQMQDAYAQMLANLNARMGDYDALGSAGYQDIAAQQLGPSALESIQLDPQGQQAQLEAMAALGELADRGGLNLADQTALNRLEGTLNRNAMARQKGLANEYAARGQLGSGAQLAMDIAGQQNAAMQASDRAEGIAGQAQQRALQAMLQRGQFGRSMSNDQYGRARDAAMARDAIEARNAAARTDAGKYNNSLRGQNFEDQLAKARGKTQLTGDINNAVFGSGRQGANTTLGQASATNSLIDSGSTAFQQYQKNQQEGDSDPDVSSYDSDVDPDEPETNYNDD